ncbi:hypothetical protein ACJ41O_012860 [Fusarium nematophilum]
MARTKTSARKSTGGKPTKLARKVIHQGPYYRHFEDHRGQTYTVVTPYFHSSKAISKLSVQLYFLGKPTPSPEVFGDKFLSSDGFSLDRTPRVDVYTDFGSVEECIEHHRREKAFRRKAVEQMRQDAAAGLSEEAAAEKLATEIRGREPLPHIVPTWCVSERFWRESYSSNRYRSWILVVPEDRSSWEDVVEKGILQVSFDLDVAPMMETDQWDEFDECPLEKEKYGWVLVSKSGVEKLPPVQRKLLCVRDPPTRELFDPWGDTPPTMEVLTAWMTPGRDSSLSEVWMNAREVFLDCTYRGPDCEGCREEVPHSPCEIDMDEHYLDEDGQCIACRRQTEYRRRSKRVAARGDRKVYGP